MLNEISMDAIVAVTGTWACTVTRRLVAAGKSKSGLYGVIGGLMVVGLAISSMRLMHG